MTTEFFGNRNQVRAEWYPVLWPDDLPNESCRGLLKKKDDSFTLDAIEEDDSKTVEVDWNLISPEYLPQI